MTKLITFSILFLASINGIYGQECTVDLMVTLKNINGGFYKGETITLNSKRNGETFQLKSDIKGKAKFTLPCNTVFDIKVSNYTRKKEIKVPNLNNSLIKKTFSYEPNMATITKQFAMSSNEKNKTKAFIKTLNDTLFLKTASMDTPKNKTYYAHIKLKVLNIKKGPLANEITTITGVTHKKSIKTKTDKNGNIDVYVPKGEKYTINFTYNQKYATFDTYYSKGSTDIKLIYNYLGTKEIERRKKIEEARIAEEELRLKKEEERFKTACDRLKLTIEECRKRELKKYIDTINNTDDETVISKILDRNSWKNKLIVCDLTGSMTPYTAELSVWYNLNLMLEKNLQFVFFNDGNNISDSKKTIGETGGIYYSSSKDIKELNTLIATVSSSGTGGDCEENDLEAIIKGSKLSKSFDNLILIADSNSPVRDLSLLNNVTTPVHIILCGYSDFILNDYLKIAWKTKGSIHTIEEDIINISKLHEGQNITIDSKTYKLMGGDFILLE